jgi:hypothetical protein
VNAWTHEPPRAQKGKNDRRIIDPHIKIYDIKKKYYQKSKKKQKEKNSVRTSDCGFRVYGDDAVFAKSRSIGKFHEKKRPRKLRGV